MKRTRLSRFVVVVAVLLVLLLQTPASAANHTVRPGDTVWKVARSYGLTLTEMLRANSLPNPNLIYPGQVLNVPYRVYTVRAGDTVWKLSQRFGTTVPEILKLNNLANPNLLYPGQALRIPVVAGDSGAAGLPSRGGGISAADLDLFARLIHAEAAGEPYVGQVAAAASVLNRVASPRYPNYLRGVILQVWNGYYQYSPVQDGRINLPASNTARQAVRDALNGWDPSLGATGFYNPRKTGNQWVRQQQVTTVIGNHVFFR